MIIAIVGGLGAAISWGVADYLSAHAAKAISPVGAVVGVNVVGLLSFASFYALTSQGGGLVASGVWFAAGAGVALGVGYVTFFHALEIGPVSVVTPLTSAYPLFTTVWVLLIFGLALSARQMLGVSLITLGVLLASGFVIKAGPNKRFLRGPVLALVTAFLWGSGYTLLSEAIETLTWQTASLVQFTAITATCLLLVPVARRDEQGTAGWHPSGVAGLCIVGAGFVQMAGFVLMNVALSRTDHLAPVITALSACYPILTILLAIALFKERPPRVAKSGALVTVLGVVVLSLG